MASMKRLGSVDILMCECRFLQPASSDAGIYRTLQRKILTSEEASYSIDASAKK
jgi:hypothetical protein